MATFDFVFMCKILYKEKCKINYASETPQKKDIGLSESAFMFNRVCEHVSNLQNCFGQLKLEVEPVEKDKRQTPVFKTNKGKGLKDTFDEVTSDYRFCSGELI